MLTPAQFYGTHLPITQEDVIAASKLLGIKPGTVAAVMEVEAGSDPFISDGRPKILYEAHKFGAGTGHKYPRHLDTKGRALSSRKWDRTLYGAAGAWQYKRLEMAMELNNQEALKACSWGGFQILASNFKMCKYNSVDEFVLDSTVSGGNHLKAFAHFVISAGLADELCRKDFAGFAAGYNGPRYAENQYDKKMAAADARLVSSWASRFAKANNPETAKELVTEAVDMSDGSAEYQLTRADINGFQAAINASRVLVKPIRVDGWYGKNTAAALKVYQRANKLQQSGLFDQPTLELLGYEPPEIAA